MKVLLDTHAMLWWWTAPERIRKKTLAVLSDPETTVFASAVSAHEMAYKHHCGKLALPDGLLKGFGDILAAERWTPLSITVEHTLLAGSLPSTHRDPFDRLLAAQATLEKARLVTMDPAFDSFSGLDILW
ncbi:MAG TPA: type II toxin-antitoxin system VapC family toxin [Terrimicrobiaceae bacterium]|nr:type II toxin-antitoxin system VapC family toxin [Terrimicrobiaceae bacterium]